VYSALYSLTEPADVSVPNHWQQLTAPLVGADLTLFAGRRFGVQASLFASSSDVRISGPFAPLDHPAHPASLRGLAISGVVAVPLGGSKDQLLLSGGLGRVERRGEAYQGDQHVAATGIALGAEGRLPLARRLWIGFGGKGFRYRMRLRSPTTTFNASTQLDLTAYTTLTARLF
jgi:hypothetical protein